MLGISKNVYYKKLNYGVDLQVSMYGVDIDILNKN